jgi:hypothetical protein
MYWRPLGKQNLGFISALIAATMKLHNLAIDKRIERVTAAKATATAGNANGRDVRRGRVGPAHVRADAASVSGGPGLPHSRTEGADGYATPIEQVRPIVRYTSELLWGDPEDPDYDEEWWRKEHEGACGMPPPALTRFPDGRARQAAPDGRRLSPGNVDRRCRAQYNPEPPQVALRKRLMQSVKLNALVRPYASAAAKKARQAGEELAYNEEDLTDSTPASASQATRAGYRV